ncbi:MAG: hypothetical protein OXI87_10495 [Albidovulum sp.]|nr:hypothetical protein [Albidovulum sp.]MDE0305295.1 hypothetical protein [Albidovulum sp.]MDE0531001.1 hypothetical protein [Albidovulum sp.]
MEWLEGVYGDHRETLDCAVEMYGGQEAVNGILRILLDRADELSNGNLVRLAEHTFLRWPSSSRC